MRTFTETLGHKSTPTVVAKELFAGLQKGAGVPPRAYFEHIAPRTPVHPREDTQKFGRTTAAPESKPLHPTDRGFVRMVHRRPITEQAALWHEVASGRAVVCPEGFSPEQAAGWQTFCVRTRAHMAPREKKFWLQQMPAAEGRAETVFAAPLRTARRELLCRGDAHARGFEIFFAAEQLGRMKPPRQRLPVSVRTVATSALTGEHISTSGTRHTRDHVSSTGVVTEDRFGRAAALCEVGMRSALADERLRMYAHTGSTTYKNFFPHDWLRCGQELFLSESRGPILPPRAEDIVEEPQAGHPGWQVVRAHGRLYVWETAAENKKVCLRGFYEGDVFYPHHDFSFHVTTGAGTDVVVDETQPNILRSVDGSVVIFPSSEAGTKISGTPRPFGVTESLHPSQAVWGEQGALHIQLVAGRHFVSAAGDVYAYDTLMGLHHVGVLGGE